MKHMKTFFLVSSLGIMVSGCSATDEEYSYVKSKDTTIDHI